MDFESDPAADFLNREKEVLGDLESEIIEKTNVEPSGEMLSSDDFEMINNDIATDPAENDDLAGMTFNSSNVSVVQEIPEKIKIWREQQSVMLEEKDIKEKEATEKLRESAKKELEDWYHTYRESKEKTKTMNRKDEKDLSTADINGSTDDATIWEKISSLCDFGSQAKAPKSGRDTTRMRSIFLQLKSSPPASKNV
ncbi:CLUMA_CG012657, isoform A [Clunio marinus]|uniref:Clathrin light chain n=1 Tax=Clunio marinus TaxID=568069 RepID=A0A1J1IJU6_9DIPT|nr:CLUMA_CG012657, isoform A [Clunio marinus]